jgi:hypothetical protein
VSGLDPKFTAEQLFEEGASARELYIYNLNHLEPPFPYKVIGLNPATYGLDSIEDPGAQRLVKV